MQSNLSVCVVKLQKALLVSGGKVKSSLILASTLKTITKLKKNSGNSLELALENISPYFILKSRKRGKKINQIPVPIFGKSKRFAYSSRNIIKSSKKHKGLSFKEKLSKELIDSSLGQGFSKKNLQEINRLILLNRASM